MTEPLRTIIGFSGRPIRGATGWKLPILFEAQADKAYLESTPAERWTMEEIQRFEEERLLSLLPNQLPYRPDAILVYAHELFVQPRTKGVPIPTHGQLDYMPRLESYVTLANRQEAIGLYRIWSEHLLKFGRKSLMSGQDPKLALATAMRARYSTLPPPLRALRLESFILAFAALAVLDRSTEPLIEDAGTDFTDEVTLIEQKGTALAAEVGERKSKFLGRDHPGATRYGPPRAEAQTPCF